VDETEAEVCGNIVVAAAGNGVEKEVKVGVPGVIELRMELAGNVVEVELMVVAGNTVEVELMVVPGNGVEVEPMVVPANAEEPVVAGITAEGACTEEPIEGYELMVAEAGDSGSELIEEPEEVKLPEEPTEGAVVDVGLEKSKSRPVVVAAKVHSLAALSESYTLSSAL